MVKLGYQVNNCSDLVMWVINSLGSEIVLTLIIFGTVLALYWLYSLLRCVDDGCQRSSRALKSISKSVYMKVQSRFFPQTIRRRSICARSSPGSSSNLVSRCFDRPKLSYTLSYSSIFYTQHNNPSLRLRNHLSYPTQRFTPFRTDPWT